MLMRLMEKSFISLKKSLGVDTASLNDGYGRALDAVYDGVISAFLPSTTSL